MTTLGYSNAKAEKMMKDIMLKAMTSDINQVSPARSGKPVWVSLIE